MDFTSTIDKEIKTLCSALPGLNKHPFSIIAIIRIMAAVQIVRLKPEEWQLYRQIRLEALLLEPQAFGSSYAENLQRPDAYWQERLAEAHTAEKGWLLFARMADKGIIGMVAAHAAGEKDEVDIISVYVRKEDRGGGVATALMAAILAEVCKEHTFQKAILTVNVDQNEAIALYRRFDFQIVAEENSVLGDGKLHPDYRMEKEFERAGDPI